MRFIDLFAGMGGIRLGLENAGAECVFSSEIDERCQETYSANFGERPWGDIREVDAEKIPDHDILAGGFPCQAFSIIGNGLGFADTRGTLFFEIQRILEVKRPYCILLENVKNLVTHDKNRTFGVILAILNNLGYQVHWKVLNGLDFGIPQKRERVFIVGFQESHPFSFPESSGRQRKELKDILENDEDVNERYFASDYIKNKFQKRVNKPFVAPSIWHENKSGNVSANEFSCALRANASYNYLLVNGRRRLTTKEMLRLQGFPDDFKVCGSDADIRRQLGNSVVVPIIEEIGKSMIDALAKPPLKTLFDYGEESDEPGAIC